MLPAEEEDSAGLGAGLTPGGAPLQGSESIETCWLGLRLYEGRFGHVGAGSAVVTGTQTGVSVLPKKAEEIWD
jgi:hypothetical protein